MVAPADGVVLVRTILANASTGGSDNNKYQVYSTCNISGYGQISAGTNCMVIVNKGSSISLSSGSTGGYGGASGSATFYPFK